MRLMMLSVATAAALAIAGPGVAQPAAEVATMGAVEQRLLPALERPARLLVDRAPLPAALTRLYERSGVPVSFSPSRLPDDLLVSCACQSSTVAEAMDEMLRGTLFRYREVEGHILVLEPTPPVIRGVEFLSGTRYAALSSPVTAPPHVSVSPPPNTRQTLVAGVVVNASTGQPIATAQVAVLGTALGAVSDLEGRFRIEGLVGEAAVLRTQRIGFRTVTQAVRVGDTNIRIALEESAMQLDEVVVSVSAAASRRAQLGTDIERLDAERALEVAAITNVSDLIRSRTPGVSVTLPSGQTGAASQLRVRGATSLTQSNTPLVYVDGVRVSNSTTAGPISFDFGNLGSQTISRVNDINPDEIADIQVIKGPSATALYGAEAAAGVLVITTKRGRAGSTRITFQTDQGIVQDIGKYQDAYYPIPLNLVSDVNDARIQQWRPVQNAVTGQVFARDNPLLNEKTRPFRTGHVSNYAVTARGGAGLSTYFTAVRFEREEGTLPNNGLTRLNLRANLDFPVGEKVMVSFSNGYVDSEIRVPHNDHSALGMVTNGMAGYPLYSFGVRADGSRGDCLATVLMGQPESVCEVRQGNLTASFDKLVTPDNGERLGRLTSSITARWEPVDWLSSRFALGVDNINTKTWQLVPLDPDRPFGARSAGYIIDARAVDRTYSADYATTISWTISGAMRSSTTIGGQYFRKEFEEVSCTGEGGFASTTATACNAAVSFSGASRLRQSVEYGALLLQQWSMNENLFLSASLRVDDSSGFGEEQRAIWSPGVNVSAVFSEMAFWRWEGVNEFRLRAAWGRAAQAPSPYAHARTFIPVRLEVSGQQVTGVTPQAPGNPQLTAERNEEFEFGFDYGLFGGRFGGKVTYFRQETTDAIVSRPIPKSLGFEQNQWVNLAKLENRGLEATLHGILVQDRRVTWEAAMSVSTESPVVTSLGDQLPTNNFRVGYAPGYRSAPIVERAERAPNGTIVPGSVVMAAPNIEGTDRRYLGRPDPTNRQSLSTTITLLDALRFYTLFDRAGGHVKYDGTTAYRTPFIASQHVSELWAMRQVSLTPEQQAALELRGVPAQAMFTHKGDFIKWREVSMTYRLPQGLLSGVLGGASAGSIGLTAQNLYTWTDYPGLDPEARDDGGEDSFQQDTFFTQPQGRRFSIRFTCEW